MPSGITVRTSAMSASSAAWSFTRTQKFGPTRAAFGSVLATTAPMRVSNSFVES